MAVGKILKFGPEPPYQTAGRGYIALDDAQAATQISGDFLVGPECSSLSEVEAVVNQLRRDLDEILRLARARFGAGP